MNKSLALDFYDLAENVIKDVKKLTENNIYNSGTAILIQNSAECYLKAMLEASIKEGTLYDLYRKIAVQKARAKGEYLREEEVTSPRIPHRLKFINNAIKDQCKLSGIKVPNRLYEHDYTQQLENIFHSYSYFRFAQDPDFHYMCHKSQDDIREAWASLQEIQEITRTFLKDREVLRSIVYEQDDDYENNYEDDYEG